MSARPQAQAEPRRWELKACPDCGNAQTAFALCEHQRAGNGPTGIDFEKLVLVAVREDRALAADIKAVAVVLYAHYIKEHDGPTVDDFKPEACEILAAVFSEVAE